MTAEFDWNGYWEGILAVPTRVAWARCRMPISPCVQMLDRFPERQWRSVLFVGCGISTEPAAVAHLGLDVTAIDPAPVAVAHAQHRPASVEEVASWFRGCRDSDLKERYRPGGRLTTVCVEVGSYVYPNDGFDIVYLPWVWQALSSAQRDRLDDSLARSVRRGGALIVAVQNLSTEEEEQTTRTIAAAGFFRWDEPDHNYPY